MVIVLQRMLDAVRVVRHGEGVSGPDCAMVVVCIIVVRGSRFRVDGLGCSVTNVSGSAVRD